RADPADACVLPVHAPVDGVEAILHRVEAVVDRGRIDADQVGDLRIGVLVGGAQGRGVAGIGVGFRSVQGGGIAGLHVAADRRLPVVGVGVCRGAAGGDGGVGIGIGRGQRRLQLRQVHRIGGGGAVGDVHDPSL